MSSTCDMRPSRQRRAAARRAAAGNGIQLAVPIRAVGRARSWPSRAACRRRAARPRCRRAGTARRRARRSASNTGCTSVGEPLMTLQHLGGRRLPLQRLLGLVEQAHVLDRDHRLVGEGLQQLDWPSAKGPARRATDDRADHARRRAASARPGRCGSRACARRIRSGAYSESASMRRRSDAAACRGSARRDRWSAPSWQREATLSDARRRRRDAPSNAATCTSLPSIEQQRRVGSALQSGAARSAIASNTGCTSVGELADDAQDLGGRGLPLERLRSR